MTTIWARTKDALASLAPIPVVDNVLLLATGAELPDQFIAYQLISDPPAQHADDAETLTFYRMQVSIFSRSGLQTLPDTIEGLMLAAGFMRAGNRELPYDKDTRHFGLACEFTFLEGA